MKKVKMVIKVLLLLQILLVFSCTSSKSNVSSAMANKPNSSLTETYWRLSELMGQPIVREDNKKEIFMIIKLKDNRVHGFSGCNTFNGMYSLPGETRISFTKFASTLMACIDMSKENELLEVFEKVDNYAIQGNTLSLNKARMAPLAKFEAVLMK
ncbi:META domain-containing protein [Flavobacterium sp.]|uniref:META domain-containing protein n=1 Tax=Flavobacterium sp. TaxID=239 RepID=UPI00286CA4DA|nr:META domain-containing protein [Flavobacterium sp.]